MPCYKIDKPQGAYNFIKRYVMASITTLSKRYQTNDMFMPKIRLKVP